MPNLTSSPELRESIALALRTLYPEQSETDFNQDLEWYSNDLFHAHWLIAEYDNEMNC